MFLIGKLLAFAESPIWWLFLVLIFLCWQMRRSALRYQILGFTTLFWLLSYAPLANWALDLWQIPISAFPTPKRPYRAAIVLGGFTNPDPEPHDRVYSGRGVDRYLHSLELYHRGIVKHLLLTGGISNILGGFDSEASQMAYLFRQAGLPDSALILEPRARTTAENAIFSKRLMDSLKITTDTVLLVTSAWHMRRAMACFNFVGIRYIPFSVDPQATTSPNIKWLNLAPSTDAWRKWEILSHELLGLWTYKLTGKA